MIRHIVLMRFKKELTTSDIEQIFVTLGSMSNIIPEILSYSWGKCNSPENLHKDFSHGFCMEFADEKKRETYLNHPHHIEVARNLVQYLEDGFNSVLVFDYTHSI